MFTKLFLIVLESSEMYFDLVASKIGTKFNNLVIYGDILVNYRRILCTNSTISQKLKIAKMWNLFSHRFQNIAHLLGQKLFWKFLVGYFIQNSYILRRSKHFFSTKSNISQTWNRKIILSFVSEHSTSFRNKIPILPLLRGGGLHVVS